MRQMLRPKPPWPEILTWAAIAIAVLVVLLRCGSSALLQCRVDAAAALPLEPEQITIGDVRALVARVKACQAGDAGVR